MLMDDTNLSAYDHFFGSLTDDPMPFFEPFATSNTVSTSVRDRPDFGFSPLTPPAFTSNHRTTPHRRQNRSPSAPAHRPSLPASTNHLQRTNHESLPPSLPGPHALPPPERPDFEVNQYSQSPFHQQSRLDQHIQLPGINTAFPEHNFTERPPSRFFWESAAGDSAFADSDFWPEFDNFTSTSNHLAIDTNRFVDLTTDSSPPHAMPATRKRVASATPHSGPSSPPSRSSKRRKPNEADVKGEEVKVEHLDLFDVDDDTGLSHVLEQQQVAAIKEQQASQGDQPIRLSTLQCIICLDSIKDMTVTHCGHLFCHTCIMEALIAGEHQGDPGKATSKCPLCRKKVSRPKEKGKDKREVVPLEIKLATRSSIAKGKAKA